MSLRSVDPIGDKRKKEDAAVLRKLKKTKTAKKIKTRPVKMTIQSASITNPRGMGIEKNMIMPKMAKEGGLMTKGNLRDAIEKVKAKEMENGGGVTKGKSIKAKISKKGVPAQSGKPLAKGQKIIMIDDIPITSKKDGGEAVPPKFKGFSKLPESVQQQMNPDLAEKFGMGGDVKGKKGKNICRGRGIARPGTGFTVR